MDFEFDESWVDAFCSQACGNIRQQLAEKQAPGKFVRRDVGGAAAKSKATGSPAATARKATASVAKKSGDPTAVASTAGSGSSKGGPPGKA